MPRLATCTALVSLLALAACKDAAKEAAAAQHAKVTAFATPAAASFSELAAQRVFVEEKLPVQATNENGVAAVSAQKVATAAAAIAKEAAKTPELAALGTAATRLESKCKSDLATATFNDLKPVAEACAGELAAFDKDYDAAKHALGDDASFPSAKADRAAADATPIGKLLHGKALAALRDGLASDTLDGKKLDTLADAASAELKTTAADVEKDLPAGKLREVFSQVLTTVVEMNKNRYGAAFSGLSGVRACIKENQHDATCRDLCNMLQDPRSADLPAIKKGIADTTAFCAAK